MRVPAQVLAALAIARLVLAPPYGIQSCMCQSKRLSGSVPFRAFRGHFSCGSFSAGSPLNHIHRRVAVGVRLVPALKAREPLPPLQFSMSVQLHALHSWPACLWLTPAIRMPHHDDAWHRAMSDEPHPPVQATLVPPAAPGHRFRVQQLNKDGIHAPRTSWPTATPRIVDRLRCLGCTLFHLSRRPNGAARAVVPSMARVERRRSVV